MPSITISSPTCNNKQAVASQSISDNKAAEPETPSGFDIREFLKVDTPTANDVNSKSKGLLTRQETVTTLP